MKKILKTKNIFVLAAFTTLFSLNINAMEEEFEFTDPSTTFEIKQTHDNTKDNTQIILKQDTEMQNAYVLGQFLQSFGKNQQIQTLKEKSQALKKQGFGIATAGKMAQALLEIGYGETKKEELSQEKEALLAIVKTRVAQIATITRNKPQQLKDETTSLQQDINQLKIVEQQVPEATSFLSKLSSFFKKS